MFWRRYYAHNDQNGELNMLTAEDALKRLQEGNRRFAANASIAATFLDSARRAALLAGQAPFAIILGCSDSRVPAELVFDQGLGDLFVIRVAGNIVAPSQVGSVEFAASRFGTPLVVVLGHTQCGAITATFEAVTGQGQAASNNLRSIVERVRPAVETVLAAGPHQSTDAIIHQAIRANVRAAVDHLKHGSALLERLVQTAGLRIVGAEYSLETGIVEFFDDW